MKKIYLFLMVLMNFQFACALETMTLKELKNKMLSDAEIIRNAFEVKYAPGEWKKKFANWTLDKEMDALKNKITKSSTITVKDYQILLKKFFSACQDYHTKIKFHSTEAALLPLQIQKAQNRYFVTWIPKDLSLPFENGDEIIFFDGKPIKEVVRALNEETFGGVDNPTNQALIESLLTYRRGSLGHRVPQGPINITVCSMRTGSVKTHSFEWSYIPEEVSAGPMISKGQSFLQHLFKPEENVVASIEAGLNHYSMYTAYEEDLSISEEQREFLNREWNLGDDDNIPSLLGNQTGFLPIFKRSATLQENEDFHAFKFITPGAHSVGFIRIPTFAKKVSNAKSFAELVSVFEKETDALVIDQTNNPGGNGLYMYALASMLTTRPLILPTQRLKITQEDIAIGVKISALLKKRLLKNNQNLDLLDFPVTSKFLHSLVDYFSFLNKEWQEGRSFTQSCYVFGVDRIDPHPKVTYSKPIVILVNALSFSCADFFPAIMQDNGRAMIFGEKTAGAGGRVFRESHPNCFGIEEYSLTDSIAERISLDPIENLGVTPDICYQLTTRDLQDSYSDYINALSATVDRLIDKKQK